MSNKMLIDATHPEETRVVVLRGNRVEEFDFESANRKQLRGNIYLAKVTRVEPSLQAAFVDYGGNRHGFLAFSEIHPDYYQIPVADRQALIAEEERAHRAADADADHRAGRRHRGNRHRGADRNRDVMRSDPLPAEELTSEAAEIPAGEVGMGIPSPEQISETASDRPATEPMSPELMAEEQAREAAEIPAGEAMMEPAPAPDAGEHAEHTEPAEHAASDTPSGNNQNGHGHNGHAGGDEHHEEESVENVGGADAMEEAQERMPRVRPRQYKIQEVIKRRQVMLVQVVKEERGSKGAALTTYLSLAGRYSVLMPNTARGGGISRKITSGEDRNRLKEIAQELEVPEGMGVILRTAGASRTKTEVKRDFEYLLRLWETVRDLTLKSTAPKLVYEEGSLTKRSIRDLYNKDIEEIVVSGDEGYKDAKDFMRMLMPSHAKHVKLYRDVQPIYTRYGIESQLDAMFTPVVQLRSGGYIVINQTEALVAIDVNSGRATREHHIEDTALKTNCEAAEEVARQLRLRDLAGLIVIDFIDMDEGRNNRTVERRLKEALRHDRARIQLSRISHFGLLEMSRQRIRTSVLESSTEKCPVCGGSGHVRSVSSVALQLLRSIEEMLVKGAMHNLIVRTRSEVALYVLNHKRAHLRALEERFKIIITVSADPTVNGQQSFIIDRGEQVHTPEAAKIIAVAAQSSVSTIVEDDPDDYIEDEVEAEAEAESETHQEIEDEFAVDSEDDEGPQPLAHSESAQETGQETDQELSHALDNAPGQEPPIDSERGDAHRRRRRRRGRGGRGRGGENREGSPFPRDNAPAQNRFAAPDQQVAHDGPDNSEPAEPGFVPQQPRQSGGPMGSEGGEHSDGGRRRRRRGRRGGRRNRGRNGDAPFQQNGNVESGPASDVPHAADDFNRQPREQALPYAPPSRADVAPTPPAISPAANADSEPPRRHSTIREPAPFTSGEGGAPTLSPTIPPPQPVISSTAKENETPKRGWWAKRLLGDK
jgi:ribonuclease E